MSTSRVLTHLFRPATALVGRLRYAQKFVVVGIVLLVPLGFVAAAYVQLQREQIAFSAKERQGVALMSPLVTLVADAAQARHRVVAGATGPGGAAQPDLDRDLAAVDVLVDRYAASLRATDEWRAARSLVGIARRAGAEGYPAYNTAIEALLNLIVHVGDESNLTLDPDLDTYYLMDTLQFRLPVLLDTAGRAIDRIAGDRAGDHNDVLIELGLDGGVLDSTGKALHRSIATIVAKTADGQVRGSTRTQFGELDKGLAELGRVLTAAVQSRQFAGVPVQAADPVRASAAVFAAGVARSLDGLLRVRIDQFSARADRVGVVAGSAALLGAYLFVGFYLGVVPPVRRIVAGLRTVAGGDLTVEVSVDTHDELSFVVGTLNDTVRQTKAATDRLALAATHDGLTALPNRTLVLDRLDGALRRNERDGRLMAVFFIDLDRFKMVNDTLGHEAGDQVLRTVADRLTRLVGGSGTVARLAGDEFVLVDEEPGTVDAAVRSAERLVTALSQPILIELPAGGREVTVGASVGIAVADGTGTLSPEDLLRDADVAMYRAKQRGRGRVEIFDDTLRIAIERRMQTEGDLRHAIDGDQLVVHYQPIVATATRSVIGFEALVRWQHPTRGLLGPGEFIDVAEETGLVVPLGAVVLAKACQQAARWRAEYPDRDLHVTVNVSAAQFAHPSFIPTVASILAETGLAPGGLWLEITETSIMADAEAAGDTLRAIRALGVRLSIDDFGTGYSSLAYLRRFPVDALKVDRSFVDGLGRDKEDEAIVAMILSLARTLDLLVVAEGVETAAQLAELDQLGCGAVQGYLLGRPGPAEHARLDRPPVHLPAGVG
jgi:diguanylate cyclase (GGDEF)-like protein